MGYDIQGQLATWQNAPSSPTTTAKYLYDGEGQRVEQQVTSGGTTTTTLYLSNLEDVAITGSTTTNTAYYYANGQRIALAVNGAISYLGSDGLGSATTTLDSSGNAQASELYMPYGGGRWGSGTMPTRRLFTGQVSDAASGLVLGVGVSLVSQIAAGQGVDPDKVAQAAVDLKLPHCRGVEMQSWTGRLVEGTRRASASPSPRRGRGRGRGPLAHSARCVLS